jgi:AAA family ATP:ADP antiporter
VGGAILVAQLVITNRIDRRESSRRATQPPVATPATVATATAAPPQKPSGTNAFAMVFRTKYLLHMALMLMLLNWVNTTGEYILGNIVKHTAGEMIASGQANGLSEGELIGDFYSKYFTMVNVLGLLLQLFVVSRVVRNLGVPWAVMILPFISLTAYNILAFVPVLYAVLAAKVAENSTDYSLNNTVRNMLFLPCTYEQKFSAKQAIDSFFVRMGDVLSAALVFVGTAVLTLQPRGFAAVNAVIVVVWIVLAWRVGREYKRLTQSGQAPAMQV